MTTPRSLQTFLFVGALALALPSGALPAPATKAASCASARAVPGQASGRTLSRATFCLINAQRNARGLAPLRLNARLSRAAAAHSRDMVARHYYSHTSLGGASFVDRIRRSGYLHGVHSWMIGENLDWGTEDFSTPYGAVYSWMHSPEHRANVLRRQFRDIGIGIVPRSPTSKGLPAATYTTDFGVRY